MIIALIIVGIVALVSLAINFFFFLRMISLVEETRAEISFIGSVEDYIKVFPDSMIADEVRKKERERNENALDGSNGEI